MNHYTCLSELRDFLRRDSYPAMDHLAVGADALFSRADDRVNEAVAVQAACNWGGQQVRSFGTDADNSSRLYAHDISPNQKIPAVTGIL